MNDATAFYKEADYTHPLSWRMNDARPPTSLALISETEPVALRSTKGITVTKVKRSDGKWQLKFDLTIDGHVGNFAAFCNDMMDSTRNVDPKDGPDAVAAQYLKWKDLFKQAGDRLDKLQIQGLLGEMIFLRDTIIPRYGTDAAIRSWVGPMRKGQDFQCVDMWYEIKTISSNKNMAKITSLDQLDREDRGRLVIMRLRDNVADSPSRITINKMYREIMDRLSPLSQCRFQAALESAGFRSHEDYDDLGFELLSVTEYEVKDGFPRLCRSKMGKGISEAVYEIDLDIICDFRVR